MHSRNGSEWTVTRQCFETPEILAPCSRCCRAASAIICSNGRQRSGASSSKWRVCAHQCRCWLPVDTPRATAFGSVIFTCYSCGGSSCKTWMNGSEMSQSAVATLSSHSAGAKQRSVLQQRHCAILSIKQVREAFLSELRHALVQTESEGKLARENGETQPASIIDLRLAAGISYRQRSLSGCRPRSERLKQKGNWYCCRATTRGECKVSAHEQRHHGLTMCVGAETRAKRLQLSSNNKKMQIEARNWMARPLPTLACLLNHACRSSAVPSS
jgi:hypothetical protein